MRKPDDGDYSGWESEPESRVDALMETLTVDDRSMILAFALLVSLAEDLAVTSAAGLWTMDPNEMLAKPHLVTGMRNQQHYDPTTLIRELQSPGLQMLYEVIEGSTKGRVKAGRGTVVRLARHYARNRLARQASRGNGGRR